MFCAQNRRRSEEDGDGGEEREEQERWGDVSYMSWAQDILPQKVLQRHFQNGCLLFNLKSFINWI